MPEDIRCPICGSEMIIKTAKKGPNAGRKFYVCTRYPTCKGRVALKGQVKIIKALGGIIRAIFGGSLGIIYLCLATAFSMLPIAGIVMLTLYLVDAGPWAPEQCNGEVVNYTDSEFGYSIAYPKCWYFEQLNDNEIGVRPKDIEYNQIQIEAFHGEPLIDSMPESQFATITEWTFQLYFEALGCTNLNVYINEPASGEWDWMSAFTVTCEDTSLQGEQFIMETQSTSYTLTILQVADIDWYAGQEVLNSFQVEK